MTLFDDISFYSPVLRINDRDLNIAFYQETLGFRLLSEENALAIFTDWGAGQSQFLIEESPAYRTRAVEGPKKLEQITIKTSHADEIVGLLAAGAQVQEIFKGDKGYAFTALSPENDRFLLHAEDDLTSLQPVETFQGQASDDFKGLTDYTVEAIKLNVPDPAASQAFYDLFENFPLEVTFNQTSGPDLAIEPNVAWDLEIIEVKVPSQTDLSVIKGYLESKGQKVYLDKKETVLAVSDPSKIEVWFSK